MTATGQSEALVLVERRGRVAVLTLNRPQASNAMSAELAEGIADALDELEADDEVWVIVITGSGERAFCAGADLKDVAGRAPGVRPKPVRGGWGGIAHRQLVKPLIAAVNGAARGGGMEICLAADLVIADAHATFGLPEVRRGLIAGAGGVERLPRRIPPVIAMELILTGRIIDAPTALEIGMINRVVESGTSVNAAVELANEICLAAPLAVRLSKAIMRSTISQGEREAVESAAELRNAWNHSADRQEGPRAFVEKRAPVWTGA
jgi:enoyl-CoA hydratase/carnithine racemase